MDTLNFGARYDFTLFDSKVICRVTIENILCKRIILMTEWIKCQIGDLCNTISDTYKGKDSLVVLVNTSDVLEGKVLNHKTVFNENLKGQFKKTFKKNDILYSEIRPANKRFAFIDFENTSNYIASTKLMVLRPNDKVLPRYLFALLKSNHLISELQHLAETRSGTFPQITFSSELSRIPVLLPNKETQKKVIDILSCIEDKIDLNLAINNNLQEQMEALHRSWFIDYAPFGDAKPSNWIKADIYSIANIIYGAPFASKFFNTEGLGNPIIRIRDLKEQTFVTYTTEIHPKGHLIQPGDIVVGMDGEFRPYIWGNSEAWLNQRVCIFESKLPSDKAFMLYTIKPLLNVIEQTQVATTVIHIGKKDYDAFEIVLPDRKTLDQFGEITTPMLERIVNNSIENKKLVQLRDALLPQLMSGELDVSKIKN